MRFKRCPECLAEIHTTVDGREIDHEPDCPYYVSLDQEPLENKETPHQ